MLVQLDDTLQQAQLQQAVDVLNELGIEGVPIVGVAKGEARRAGDETLIVAGSGRTLFPGPASPASHLVQAVRDEAHRFAITGHRGDRRCSSTSVASAACPRPASRNSCK